LGRAQALAGEQRQRLEQVIADLEAEASAARLAKEEARAESARLRDLNHNLAIKERKLTERLERAIDTERHKAITEARRARDAARALRERLREQSAAASAEALSASERQMEELADGLAAEDARDKVARYPQDLDLATLKVGQRVWVISLNNHAEVTRLPNSKGRCLVSAGRMSVDVDAAELRQPRARSAKERERDRELEQQRKRDREAESQPRAPKVASWETASPQSPDLTCDVRGQRVEDAFVLIERHLDALMGRGASVAYIIHGHGTGALKKAVRDWLRRLPTIQDQRPGQPHEGGDGVTAALLTPRRG
jgi:DNA mismatch repair protein MutS2